jgi:predicted phage terminase large subunit-like protein
MSATQLEKIWDWMITDFRSRLVPNGKELIITTRWARRDPAGRILDLIASGVETGWHVLRLPMLCDSENDPMERAIGDPLWPEWFTERMVQEAKRDPLRWSALYQQRPLDESGAWVPMENVHLNDKTPSALNHIIAVDLALSVGRGDYTSIVTTGLDEDRHIHIVDIQRRRIPPNETADLLFELCHRFSPSAVLIDDDPAAKVFTRLLYELARERRQSIPLMPLPLRGRDKETRASAIRGWFLQDRVHIKRALWNDDLIREINEFPTGDHDDQIDALGLVGRYLVSAWSPSTPERVITDPYEGWLVRPDQPDVMQCSLDELFEAKPQRSLRI